MTSSEASGTMPHPATRFDPPKPYVEPIAYADLTEVKASDLVATARNLRNAEEHYMAAQLERAAKTIELGRLRDWESRRKLAISEAARLAEAEAADEDEDDAAWGVLPGPAAAVPACPADHFLAALAAALPAGTRCSIHLERERAPAPAPCGAGIVPGPTKIAPC